MSSSNIISTPLLAMFVSKPGHEPRQIPPIFPWIFGEQGTPRKTNNDLTGFLNPKRPKTNQPLMPTTSPQNSPPHFRMISTQVMDLFFFDKIFGGYFQLVS